MTFLLILFINSARIETKTYPTNAACVQAGEAALDALFAKDALLAEAAYVCQPVRK